MNPPPAFPWIPVVFSLAPLGMALLAWSGRVRYRHRMALVGIPMAASAALLCGTEIARLLYGQADPLFLALECASLLALAALVLLLRSRLAQSREPGGFYRDVLDFLGMWRWHPAARFALAALLVLPLAWLALVNHWMFDTFASLGRRALAHGDVQNALDGFAVVVQYALAAGTPALFLFHLLCRRWLRGPVLPWLFLPLLFVGIAAEMVVVLTFAHFSR